MALIALVGLLVFGLFAVCGLTVAQAVPSPSAHFGSAAPSSDSGSVLVGFDLPFPAAIGPISVEAFAAGLVAAGVTRYSTRKGPIAIPVLVAIQARRTQRLAAEGWVIIEGLQEEAAELGEEFGRFDPPTGGWGG